MAQILEKYEEIVVEAIRDYLKQNRIFDMKKIIPYLISTFSKSKKIKINNEGIQKILISLAKKKIIVEGTKLTKKDVLRSSRRKKIYNYIKENPGTYINKIANDLKIWNFDVCWHLRILVKFNFIKKKIIDNHISYFDSNIDLRHANKLQLISKDISKKIINYLKINNFGTVRNKLATDLKVHYSTIQKYIDSLEEFNIISKEKRSNQILYFLEEPYIM